MIHSEKGIQIINEIKSAIELSGPYPLDQLVAKNKYALKSVKIHPKRERAFYQLIQGNRSFFKIVINNIEPFILRRIFRKVKKVYSIRMEPRDKNLLIRKFGSLQRAIDFFILQTTDIEKYSKGLVEPTGKGGK